MQAREFHYVRMNKHRLFPRLEVVLLKSANKTWLGPFVYFIFICDTNARLDCSGEWALHV